MPPIVVQIANWIPTILSIAPKVQEAVKSIAAFIQGLFSSGVITKEQQDQLMAYLDACAVSWLHGETPPAWQVEADPPAPAP